MNAFKAYKTGPKSTERIRLPHLFFLMSLVLTGTTMVATSRLSQIVVGSEKNLPSVGALLVPAAVETKKLTPLDPAPDDRFGNSVAISGDTIVVGSITDDGPGGQNLGSIYIFERNAGGPNNWGEVKHIFASDPGVGDNFGGAVAISSNTIVVGAHLDNVDFGTDRGSVYIYERNAGGPNNWGEVKRLLASDGSGGDQFGVSVSISGDSVIVGAYLDDGTAGSAQGSAYIYYRNHGGSNNWGEVKHLFASDPSPVDEFGFAVSINEDTAIVGAPFDDNSAGANQGSAYVFRKNHGGSDNWGEVKHMFASDALAEDWFAWSVAHDGDTAVVGSVNDDNTAGSSQGSVYVYERHEGGLDNWGESKHIFAADAGAGDAFGAAVSVAENTMIVGASSDSGSAGMLQGSVYVYERNHAGPNSWGALDHFFASDGAQGDQFGDAAAISGNDFVVGAFLNDGSAGANQGSAYVYALRPPICFDFDGDGKSDVGIFRPSSGTWYVLKSQTGTAEQFQFGADGDVPLDADFDGDLRADFAVWRPADGTWYYRRSSDGVFGGAQWGANGDRVVAADYDADGKTDLAVWRPSDGLNYIVKSTGGFLGVQWGTVGDIPSHTDIDGDGKTDFAVFRPSNGTWYTLINGTSTNDALQFGQNGDIPVRADVDGDQKGDIMVWRPTTGEWFFRRSSNGTFGGLQWGGSGDRPVPGDYDGDGRTDFGVWRSTDGTHYIVRNSGGFLGVVWGAAGDIPILGSPVP